MPFTFEPLAIADVLLIGTRALHDERGYFLETYKQSEFARAGITAAFVQSNFSRSCQRAVLRGLHYQLAPHAQAKLVHVVRGEIFDVAVDLRRGSPSFGKWVSAILSEQNHNMLWVPEGFAHGFIVLSDQADVVYNVTHEWTPAAERTVRWDDPTLRIEWPLDAIAGAPILAAKDAAAPLLADAENNFVMSSRS